MRLKNSDYRQIVHSIKYLEYYWGEYKIKFPVESSDYYYRKEIEEFIEKNYYTQLRRGKLEKVSRDIIISKKQYRSILFYGRICTELSSYLQ